MKRKEIVDLLAGEGELEREVYKGAWLGSDLDLDSQDGLNCLLKNISNGDTYRRKPSLKRIPHTKESFKLGTIISFKGCDGDLMVYAKSYEYIYYHDDAQMTYEELMKEDVYCPNGELTYQEVE